MKKIGNTVYCVLFVGLLLLPFLFTDFRKNQISELDNTYLPELSWEEDTPIRERVGELENYLNMRIGFRSQSLTWHQLINYALFHQIDHPLYMFGKEGHVFLNTEKYINDYQHLNLDAEWARRFADWMVTFRDLSEAHGASYYYLLIPDKKTLYAEFFPSGYNQLGEISRTDQALEALGKTDVNWLYAKDAMLAAKEEMPVANVKYDVGHCNENGTFVFCRLLLDRIRVDYPEVPALEREEFSVEMVEQAYLPDSYFPIHEEVPVYHPLTSSVVSKGTWLKEHLSFRENTSHTRFVDPEHPELPKLLVLHDSYLKSKEKFFFGHFSEITFIHRDNLLGPHSLERYLEVLQPDIVVYENPERSFSPGYDPAQ